MAGAEAALLANDACGAPVPWLVAAPWLYFDGKLLQRNLHRANHCKHLAQLCDNHLDTVVKVGRAYFLNVPISSLAYCLRSE